MKNVQMLQIPFLEFNTLTTPEISQKLTTPTKNMQNICLSQRKALPLQQSFQTTVSMTISKATQSNWTKLHTTAEGRLSKRANKTLSVKKIIASSYAQSINAKQLLEIIMPVQAKIEDIIYTLCINKLHAANIEKLPHVQNSIEEYNNYHVLPIDIPHEIWDTNDDLLGFAFQSLLNEGERNATGQYYTNKSIVENMLSNLHLSENETFYDPCCGSGAFLMGVETYYPENLYGTDINPLAVLITRVNLLTKHSNKVFTPNIYCKDYLIDSSTKEKFDYIYTNPPWGADKQHKYKLNEINSKERSSMFLVKALKMLKPQGHLHFLLPTSLLKIQTHKDIRKYILNNSTIQCMSIYSNRFDGVFTNFFSIKLLPVSTLSQKYVVKQNESILSIQCDVLKDKYEIPIIENNLLDESIKHKVALKANDYLTHSKWALGIVTGNNKEKLLTTQDGESEPIITGKEIEQFTIAKEQKYIVFNPAKFQQCAKEEFFRAPEKLIYKFISNRPIVAYDNQQLLCLNSANILIPDIETISIKSMTAFLNSALYQYLYITQFSDCKILKTNLCTLPFPAIPLHLDRKLSNLVTQIIQQNNKTIFLQEINTEIFDFFDITTEERNFINQCIKQ